MLEKQKIIDGILNLYIEYPTSIEESVQSWFNIYKEYASEATLGSGMSLIQNTWDEGSFKEELTKALNGSDLENSTQYFDNAFGKFWLTTSFSSSGGNTPTATTAIFGSMKEELDLKKTTPTAYMDDQQTAEFFGTLIDTYTKLVFNIVIVPGTPPIPTPFPLQ